MAPPRQVSKQEIVDALSREIAEGTYSPDTQQPDPLSPGDHRLTLAPLRSHKSRRHHADQRIDPTQLLIQPLLPILTSHDPLIRILVAGRVVDPGDLAETRCFRAATFSCRDTSSSASLLRSRRTSTVVRPSRQRKSRYKIDSSSIRRSPTTAQHTRSAGQDPASRFRAPQQTPRGLLAPMTAGPSLIGTLARLRTVLPERREYKADRSPAAARSAATLTPAAW